MRKHTILAVILLLMLLFSCCTAPGIPDIEDAGAAEEEENTPVYSVYPGRRSQNTTEVPAEEPPPIQDPEEPGADTADPTAYTIETIMGQMSLKERVAQMFFIGCPASGAEDVLKEYALGGYILFSSFFADETAENVQAKIARLQAASGIPLLVGVDEEGGTVVRVSSNQNLRQSRFRSPRALFEEGGMELVVSREEEKAQLLKSLGINVNLAPVCDVSGNESDFIYKRSFSGDAGEVSEFVTAAVAVMQEAGIGSVLKHFPGYGNNADTHEGIVIDHRDISDFYVVDFLPFRAGVQSGARSVMVCHNIVEAFDDTRPASLSPEVYAVLRNTLGADLVVLTDDLDMSGITKYCEGTAAAVQAVIAGSDMLLTSNYASQIDAVHIAVLDGIISEERINASVIRILKWKIELGLIPLMEP